VTPEGVRNGIAPLHCPLSCEPYLNETLDNTVHSAHTCFTLRQESGSPRAEREGNATWKGCTERGLSSVQDNTVLYSTPAPAPLAGGHL